MNGKSKCKILKDIRREIARNNGIEFITSECTFQGECSGTCPKCEAELRRLEQELEKRRLAGKAIAVAGIAAAMVVTAAGCSPNTDLLQSGHTMGDIAPSETIPAQKEPDTSVTMGAPSSADQQEIVLSGDIAYAPDSTPELFPGEVPAPG